MSTDFRALCVERPSDEELGLIYHDCCRGCEFMDQGGFEDAARAVLARWGRPTPPAPPAEGEIDQLVSQLRDYAQGEADNGWHDDAARFRRAAELLAQAHSTPPAPVPVPVPEPVAEPPAVAERPSDGEVAELVAWLHGQDGGLGRRAIYARIAELLQRLAAPVPVPVAERPWERKGWCDMDGECWWCPPDGPAYWSMVNPAMVYGGWLLPHWAIHQLPQGGEVEP